VRSLALLLVACLSACSSAPALRASATLPPAALGAPQRYVVVTVRNPVNLPTARAASSPRGYDNVGPYLAGSVARAAARKLSREYGLQETASWPIALLDVHCLVYQLAPGADPAALVARLSRDPLVESAQPLQGFEAAAHPYNDPYAQLQQNMQRMDVEAAHGFSRGAGVKVALIDTGVEAHHPDLPVTVSVRNFVDNDAIAFNSDAHGTAVAGLIAAIPDNGIGIVGIAPDATLLAYKACWRAAATGIRAVCNTFTLAQALAAAIEAHADIINLSLAGPSDPLLTRLIRRAIDAGIIVIGAVPPEGFADAFPSDIAGVIAVDTIEDHQVVAGVLRAPGRDILSLAPQGHYDYYSGSSLAAAEITGIVALLRSSHPHLTSAEAVALLQVGPSSAPDACTALGVLLHKRTCS
jgi:subtilisin family serine protease